MSDLASMYLENSKLDCMRKVFPCFNGELRQINDVCLLAYALEVIKAKVVLVYEVSDFNKVNAYKELLSEWYYDADELRWFRLKTSTVVKPKEKSQLKLDIVALYNTLYVKHLKENLSIVGCTLLREYSATFNANTLDFIMSSHIDLCGSLLASDLNFKH